MSKEIRKMIDRVKNFEQFVNENKEDLTIDSLIDELVNLGVFTLEQAENYKRKKNQFLNLGRESLQRFIDFNGAKISNEQFVNILNKIDKLYRLSGD